MEFSTKKPKEMTSNMHQDLQTVNKLSQFHHLMKALKLLLSPSIFTFLLSYYSWLIFFHHYFIVLHSIDRSYMFLVCNGVLVFLARDSGFIGGRSSSPFKGTTEILEDADEINRENLQLDHHQDFIQLEYSEMKYDLEEEEKELELQLLITQGHDHYEEEEEDHYEEHGLLSGDELKKKCDDFIKKVKEQIRIEA